ncbi:5-methyltetrahydropteroyltriglutamate--homocysteine S-methyltransferase [Blattabacterium sp. (Cryptocercus kyebangensis)]|uniref:5-methyltetrahydropteroyltriglutamate-- homocysteine S-methyltransferase n=1 Tax=Blattabacterium sp. (Cryptocercus kyebangensis) TaxID=298656 RepID=UPI000D7C1A04|nr:5-methyltetrahydropteroyltriglutamate--homocysteine S-methyltransferase [Blattabacterium sp. (Cryptocercus kyebangensis)]AWU43993.1 5-methyltetrahydropteroyltriglutamate--homocysteine S-methyltransferase [Blattabacterium sp. (Cryptocercus kyebangensis)]
MLKHNLGYPRIGIQRELKKSCEDYWSNNIGSKDLFNIGYKIRKENWKTQENAGLDLIPCNDFSFYDHVLDMSFLLGSIPESYSSIPMIHDIDLYFSMARGFQRDGWDIKAMEMTKWFNTNYHYIVPEFYKNQKFYILSKKIFDEFDEVKKVVKKIPKPILIGPVTYLFLGKEKENSFHRMDLIENIVPVYIQIIKKLKDQGATWIQIDEPILVLDLSQKEIEAFKYAYQEIYKICSEINILLTSYFDGISENIFLLKNLTIPALHIDLIEDPEQLEKILDFLIDKKTILSLGLIDGRNIWKNNYVHSIKKIEKSIKILGEKRVMIAPNCSLLHVPIDIGYEYSIHMDIKERMSFAKQKIYELSDLENIIKGNESILLKNLDSLEKTKTSFIFHDKKVKERVTKIKGKDIKRKSPFRIRQKKQHKKFNLPLFPTTTIGSFPQTKEIRNLRSKFRKKKLSKEEYENKIQEFIIDVIRKQEKINLDVLVHGEFERNDMVEFFSEKLKGFLSTENGWVQSYGSRCVKPPVIYGDISRMSDMTVKWICFAKSKTDKLMKGMLTGPVTILQWSFVRDDQPISTTAYQIAWAIRDEVKSLEKSGIQIIQIDEPAIREGLPLKKKDWNSYFNWSIKAFRLSSSGVEDETQIHTHMCYSEFNDILKHIADLDADVITIETSRSKMELLKAFSEFSYPNEIGPGVYDIHSPRIPTVEEIFDLIRKASNKIPIKNIWINPDCGLKTRRWEEVIKSLKNMTESAKIARKKLIN